MRHEKAFILRTGRLVKVIITGVLDADLSKVGVEIDVLIKDHRDEHFHPPIGSSHPRYWKLKRLDADQARVLQIRYSGLSQRQLRQAMKEFEQMSASALISNCADICLAMWSILWINLNL